MRKMLLALLAMFLMTGLVVAVEVGVVSYDKDKKELKVKEGKETKTYKVDPKGKFTVTDKNGENAKEVDFAAFEKRFSKGKGKVDITVKEGTDTITEVKWKGGKKGK